MRGMQEREIKEKIKAQAQEDEEIVKRSCLNASGGSVDLGEMWEKPW
jgi:hypothetical protein